MADFDIPYDQIEAARAEGYSDRQIADHVGQMLGISDQITAARKEGYSDRDIVSYLSPPPKQEEPKAAEPEKEKKDATIGDDFERGLLNARSDSQMLGAAVAGRNLSAIEASKAKADRGEFLSPFEREQARQYDEAKANTQRQFGETVAGAIDYRKKADDLPISPEYKAFKDAAGKGFSETISAFWDAPIQLTASIIAEGAAASAPSLGAGMVGGLGAGAAVAGGQAYLQAYAGKVTELLAKKGVDINNKDAVMAALSDPKVADDIRNDAALSAIPQAAAGAGGMLIAGKMLAPASLAGRPVAQQAVNIPSQAAAQGLIAMAGEAGSSAIIGEDIDGGKLAAAGIGGAAQGPLDVAAFGAHYGYARARGGKGVNAPTPEASPRPPTIEEAGAAVMQAPDVDSAMAAMRDTLDKTQTYEVIANLRATGDEVAGQQADLMSLYRQMGGKIQSDDAGNFYHEDSKGKVTRLEPWDGEQRPDTISSDLVAAQRDAYGKMGLEVIYIDDAKTPFDGVFDQDTGKVYLSNHPGRNAATVGAHEVGHALLETPLPGQESLATAFYEEIRDKLTDAGWDRARELFGKTAPERSSFPKGEDGDARYVVAVERHLVNEMGAEMMAELPKLETFLPAVIDRVQSRYGIDVAKEALQTFLTNLRESMTRLREFFFRAGESFGKAEGPQPPAQIQHYLTNMEGVFKIGVDLYAERFGTQAEKQDASLRQAREKTQREQMLQDFEQPAAQTEAPAGNLPPVPEGYVRVWHGGQDPAGKGSTAVSSSRDYAAGYADMNGGKVWYADVPASSPWLVKIEGTDYVQNSVAPAEVSGLFKPVQSEQPEKPRGLIDMAAAEPSEPQPIGPRPGAAYADAVQKVASYRRWLVELDEKRRADAPNSPEARALQGQIDTILSKVRGNEKRMTEVAKSRLEAARTALREILDPIGDSPDMARVRAAMDAELARMADAAAVGTPSPGMERAVRPGPSRRVPAPKVRAPIEYRGRAVMPEPEAAAPAPAPEVTNRPVEAAPVPEAAPAPEVAPIDPAQLQREQEAVRAMQERMQTPAAPVEAAPIEAPAPTQLQREQEAVRAMRNPVPDEDLPRPAEVRWDPPVDWEPDAESLSQARRISRGWTPETELRRPQSLVDFVRKNGGLRMDTPEAGDLSAADLNRLPGLLQRQGRQADWMAQAAADAGYNFGPETRYGSGVDVDAFIAALTEDASGRRKHYPDDHDTEQWRQQQAMHAELHNYLEDLGLKPKGMDPRRLAWILQREPEAARTLAMVERVDQLMENSSLELARRLDEDMARAQEDLTPEPGAWEMGDHRDLPSPTLEELERYHAGFERARSADRAGQPAAQEPRPAAQGTPADRPAAPARPEAARPAQEAPRARPAGGDALERQSGEAVGPRVFVNRLGPDGLTDAERAAGMRGYADPKAEAPAAPEPKAPPARQEATPDHRFAEEIADLIETGHQVDGRALQETAERLYGGTLASGAFTRDRLYDAVELAVNRYIQRHPERFSPSGPARVAQQIARDLAEVKERMPTQTVRAGEKDAYQQFSTPPDYAFAAAWIANLKSTDHVLEPSAGVGGLIVHAKTLGVRETTANELSDKRRSMLGALNLTRITGEDAAQLHNILPDNVRPTVVLMNPPFSRAAERMGGKMVADEGAKHIEQALARLEPGGRLVAIVGDGMKPAGTVTEGAQRQGGGYGFKGWWDKIGREYDVRANVGVDREIYRKYGTSFPTRFLVIDKNPPSGRPLVTGQARDAVDLIARLQEVRDERAPIQQVADEPGRQEVATVAGPGGELPRAAGGVGPGEGRGGSVGPAVTEPAESVRRARNGGDAGRDGPGRGEPMVRGEPEPAIRRADQEPAVATDFGDEPGGSGADRGRDGLRPDGSGERVEPGVTPAPEDVLKTEEAVTTPDDRGITEAVYEAYRPQRVKIVGAKEHPGALVQSAAMASVVPPKTDYKPRIPAPLVKDGALSDAQLEAITYAGHAHSDVLPDGRRRGFFIGDGTGVGKGREIAGILLDNKQQGRKKAIWVTEKRQLINDAKRDWSGLLQPASEIIDHGKIKAGDPITVKQGVLFTGYDTLRSAEQIKTEGGKVRGRSRVDQIVEWVGPDFDGVIAFDEAHNLGNATDEKGSRGVKKASQKALAGVELQQRLPNARVVYVSATGATEVSNLAYAERLGLWGEGTAFGNRQDFMGRVTEGGMAAMELVARDMKALGHYIARNLSYDGVEYQRLEHKLTGDQRATYDKLAEGWQAVLQNFEKALEVTGATEDGKSQAGSRAKSAAMSAFWGAHQRFFNQIITSMQMPAVLRGVEADLKAGRQAVLQLVNTMEAAQERALEKARARGEDLDDLDMTPRDQLMQLIEKSFPVQQMEKYVDDNGNERSRPAVDSKGNPVLNKQAVAMRDRLLDEIGSIRVPDGPLEILLNHFGTDKVAEVTGRGQRVVRKVDDETGQMKAVVEKRAAQSNIADANDFQTGKKPILVFSEAGGTGRSYHAEVGSGSEKARRSHYLVQGGWRADKAVQGFGRTHRTNQASAPIFNLVTTDLQGQKRFISSIARRLGQLGALTKGERRAGDQGLFGARDNLESTEARDALRAFYNDVDRGNIEGIDMRTLEQGMGLKMRDPETRQLAKDLPPMETFLNRVLSLKIEDQNRVFDAFSARLDDVIDKAAASGTLDVGVETYKADRLVKVNDQVVYTDPRSGAETKHVHLSVQNRNRPASFDDTLAGRNKTNGKAPEYFVQNEQSGNVFAVTSAGTKTLDNGAVVDQLRLTSPLDYQFVEADKLKYGRNWKQITEDQARPLWDQQVANTPEYRKSDLHLITGAVLPIWDRLGGSPKIYRLQTEDGERMLGRVIPASRVEDTLKRLGAEGLKVSESPGEIAQRVLGGATAQLANEWKIKPSRVAGETRLEIVGPDYRHQEELRRNGVFSERIDYKTRFFIPTEPEAAAAAIEGLTKTRPVTSLGGDGPMFSPRLPGETPLFEAPEATQAELDARQRRTDKDLAEANMRGRKMAAKPQESADDTPLFGGERQKTLFSPRQEDRREPAPTFYSAVERAVQNAKTEKAAPGQWLGTLKNMPGVKPEEVQWLGLEDWLKQQPKSVTKQEVLDYVRANQIEVREVMKGETKVTPEMRDDMAREMYGDAETYRNLPSEDKRAVDEALARNVNKTGYDQYTLPGGENYRELLLTLPAKREWLDGSPVTAEDLATQHGREAADRVASYVGDVYRSSHWDEPNVLAHIRFDDRTGPNGEKVLHVAEVQSDWHQEGRKKGYAGEINKERAEALGYSVYKTKSNLGSDAYFLRGPDSVRNVPNFGSKTEAEAWERLISFIKENDRSVPDAPFKTTWPELAMKRVIRYAAENGYDRVTWDTGATNADRYDLSKYISEVRFNERFGLLEAMDRSGNRVLDKAGVRPEDVPDIIGKEAAERLMAVEPKDGARTLSGQDLKVGGEGMVGFYDKQLPIIANKLGKKFGAKVGMGQVTGEGGSWRASRFMRAAGREGDIAAASSREELMNVLRGQGQLEADGTFSGTIRNSGTPAHSLPITDAMRRAVVEEGQPLFSPRQEKQTEDRLQAIAGEKADLFLEASRIKNDNSRDAAARRGEIASKRRALEEEEARLLKADEPSAERRANGQTDTPEFRRWFGASKMVERNGEPTVFYHGTNADITAFDADKGAYGNRGLYFSKDPGLSSIYATYRAKGEGASVYPVYLKIESPLVIDDSMWSKIKAALTGKRTDLLLNGKAKSSAYLTPERIEALKAKGYDGIVNRAANEVVAFEPTQIKSAIGNRGTFDPSNPDIRYSPRVTGTEGYTDEQRAAAGRVRGTERQSLAEKIDEVRKDFGKKITREIWDPYVGVKGRDPGGYLYLREANSSLGAIEMFNTWGRVGFDGSTFRMGKEDGGPARLIDDLGAEAMRFMDWVAANRAERLKAEDRENLYSDEDIATLKTLNQGEFEKGYVLPNGKVTYSREAAYLDALNRLDRINQNARDLVVESGLVKREVVDALWSDPYYVPFYRQADEEGTRRFVGASMQPGMVGQSAGKKLLGGSDKLKPNLWQNAFGNWAHMIDASIRNRAANRVLEQAAEDGIVSRVSPEVYERSRKKGRDSDVVWTMVDGEKAYWQVHDDFTLKAITALDYVRSDGPFMAVGRAAKKLLQTGVAASPKFQITNLIRDTENALGVSRISFNVFRNLADGAKQQDISNNLQNVARAVAPVIFGETRPNRISRETADAIAGGATMRYASGVDQSFQRADTFLDSETKIGKFWDYFRKVGKASTEAMSVTENMNRLALYRQLGEGDNPLPHDLRAFEARDLSDFTLVGASPIIRHLVEVVPYMNAWLQGLYKVGRTAADADRSVALAVGGRVAVQMTTRLAAVMVSMVAANMALDAIYADDPDYQNRSEYDRNSNFWFKVGGKEYRIPMGFEVAALSRLAAIWAETLYDKNMTVGRAWRNTLQIVGTQMAFNPTPQAVKPLIDVYANESRTGTPIETKGMERLRPEFRSGPETTLAAQRLSEATNKAARAVGGESARSFSPAQIDYLAQAYAGWLGTSAMQIADTAMRAMSKEPPKPAKDRLAFWTMGMVTNDRTSERGNGFYINMLYKQGDAIQEAYSTFTDLAKRGRGDEARDYLKANKDLISKYPVYSKAIQTEGDINRAIRLITESQTLSPEQKKIKIMALNAAKNRIAEGVFRAVPQ